MTSVLFRCDGSVEIGFGHIVRCLALAEELTRRHACEVAFSMRTGSIGMEMVKEIGYLVFTPRQSGQTFNYKQWLNQCVGDVKAQVLVLDVRDDLPQNAIDELKKNGVLIVTIDDPSQRRLSADLVFCPPTPQAQRMDWNGFTGEIYAGLEWVILRNEFSDASNYSRKIDRSKTPSILVSMGGSDPRGMTLKTVSAIEETEEDLFVVLVLGAGFKHKRTLSHMLSDCRHSFVVREDVKNMAELMSGCDMAIASFGVTAYELTAMGVPAIYLSLTEDHAESASIFVEAGTAVSLGVFSSVSKKDIVTAIGSLLGDPNQLQFMRQQAVGLVDGRGVERIADIITSSVTNQGSVETPELFRVEN